ncbi:MAG: DUF4434 domain-containing protein [Acidobacteriota bacterium]|nr:MAG: DUF4434 domain-containing protein [Acidobacteriota bacterium]
MRFPTPLILLLTIALVSVSLFPQDATVRIQGTFLQLTEDRSYGAPEQLREIFEHCRDMGISELVIQWTVFDELAFFASEGNRTSRAPVFGQLLELAAEYGISLHVGLVSDPAFWTQIQKSHELTEQYLVRYRSRSKAAARELGMLLRESPGFKGWYLTEEIDDMNWLEPGRREVLFAHLSALTGYLRQLTPEMGVAISGFSNGFADPLTLGRFWQELVETTGVTTVLFQDGVGARKLDLFSLPLYLEELQRSLANRARLIPVTELFEQAAGPEGAFGAHPAGLERVKRQLEIARKFSSGPLFAFSTIDYMSSFAGEEAADLAERYLQQPDPAVSR